MLKNNRGVTLIELVMTIVIVSIAVVTLLAITSQTSERSVDPMIQQQAIAIGQSYLEEIVQKSFCDPDVAADCVVACAGASACGNAACTVAEGAANRNIYDDVCDYDGLTNNGAVDQTGAAIPGLGLYNINVQIVDNNTVNLNGLTGDQGQVVRIDVVVTHPAMQDNIRISGARVNF
ncbi:MAG: type II secretion system protein [Proteobacteria bacterium]|nr:type II secretion system protein [Pseudomonadota bacterium]